MTRLEWALRWFSALCIVLAAWALFWPRGLPEDEIAPEVAAAAAAPGAGPPRPDPAAVEAIHAGNIFSRTRAAPSTRYNPVEADADRYAPAVTESVVTEAPADEESMVPRLFGIVAGPGGASALLRLDPAVPEAQLYREGERGGLYRVVKINEQSVVLSGSGGPIVLRLIRPEGQTP